MAERADRCNSIVMFSIPGKLFRHEPQNITKKIPAGRNVLQLATERLEWIFDTQDGVSLSFSGGKDSSVLFLLAAAVARRRQRRFSVLFIDWEA